MGRLTCRQICKRKIASAPIPIALNDDQRDQIFDDVRRRGGLRCDIVGTLRFIPRGDLMEGMYGREVPQLYLEVQQLIPRVRQRRESVEVTAAVTFRAVHEDYTELQVSYVTFDAADRDDLARAADWLESTYVKEAYSGRILTDFDEQVRHFDEATFSLHRLLNGLIPRGEALEVDQALNGHGQIIRALEQQGAILNGDVYVVGAAAAVGPNASASGATIHVNKGMRDE